MMVVKQSVTLKLYHGDGASQNIHPKVMLFQSLSLTSRPDMFRTPPFDHVLISYPVFRLVPELFVVLSTFFSAITEQAQPLNAMELGIGRYTGGQQARNARGASAATAHARISKSGGASIVAAQRFI